MYVAGRLTAKAHATEPGMPPLTGGAGFEAHAASHADGAAKHGTRAGVEYPPTWTAIVRCRACVLASSPLSLTPPGAGLLGATATSHVDVCSGRGRFRGACSRGRGQRGMGIGGSAGRPHSRVPTGGCGASAEQVCARNASIPAASSTDVALPPVHWHLFAASRAGGCGRSTRTRWYA